VRAGELFSILPLRGLADCVVNSGFPFELPALKPVLAGRNGLLPHPDAFRNYAGFLDARIRYERIQNLIESVEGLEPEQITRHDLIPGDAVVREFIGGGTIRIPHNE
jgi:hypothetical protein